MSLLWRGCGGFYLFSSQIQLLLQCKDQMLSKFLISFDVCTMTAATVWDWQKNVDKNGASVQFPCQMFTFHIEFFLWAENVISSLLTLCALLSIV